MWFNHVIIYPYELQETLDLASALAEEVLKPCPPHARFTYGWLPAFNEDLLIETANASLICLGKEERLLPRTVILQALKERIQAIETEQQRRLKRQESLQLAQDLEFELLPKSFCIQKKTFALLDAKAKHLIVNASSLNQASQLTSFLRKTAPAIKVEPLNHDKNLAQRFAQWIINPQLLPPAFQLASDCLLFAMDDEKKRVNCKGYELPANEISTLLSQGLAAAELSLIWKERIQFTLTQQLTLKRLKCLDYLTDEFNEAKGLEEESEQMLAALSLLCQELRQLIDDLLTGLIQRIPAAQTSIVA